MFLYSALLIFIAWIVIIFLLKDNNKYEELKNKDILSENKITTRGVIKSLIKDKNFISFNLAGFINNFIIMGVFYAIPQYLESITGIDSMWKIFMPSVIIAVLLSRIILKKSSIKKNIKSLIISFVLCALGISFYFNETSFLFIFIGTALFMLGYISITIAISSLGNFILENEYRGVGNGILNSFQFIGSFIGSIIFAVTWIRSEKLAFSMLIIISLIGASIVKFNVKGDKFHER